MPKNAHVPLQWLPTCHDNSELLVLVEKFRHDKAVNECALQNTFLNIRRKLQVHPSSWVAASFVD